MVMMVMVVVVVVVMMVMIMSIKCHSSIGIVSKKGFIFFCNSHLFGTALTANMPVEANYPIRGCHHNMQFMANHQNRAAAPVSGKLYLLVKKHAAAR